MNENIKTMLTAGIISFCVTFGVLLVAVSFASNKGIIPHESGEAVYITGEACTINAHEDINEQEFLDLSMWCYRRHLAR